MRVRHSYGSRVKSAFAGMVIGAILFFGSFVLLAWNERDAVRQTAAISEIETVAVENVDVNRVAPENENQLVHLRGQAATTDELENRQFGVRLPAIRLRWDASIYQMEEDEDRRDDETVYSYHERWVDRPIDSTGFRDPAYRAANQGSRQSLRDGREQARDVRLGAFRLSESLIEQIGNERRFELTGGPLASLAASAEADPQASPASDAGDQAAFPPGTISQGVFYTGDPASPRIGDEKIEFFIVDPQQDVTVMAVQRQESFAPFRTRVGIDKELLYMGLLSKAEVIDRQRTEALIKRWVLRLAGFLAMWIGMMLAFKPIKALLSFLPFVDDLVGFVVGAFTFGLALAMSLVTIAVFWFAARPVMAGCLLAAAAVLAYLLLFRRRSRPIEVAPLPTPEIVE